MSKYFVFFGFNINNISLNIHIVKLFFWALSSFLFGYQLEAFSADIHVAETVGGRIVKVENDSTCHKKCDDRHNLENFLALPFEGYKFQAWQGACSKALGQLCTASVEPTNKPTAVFSVSETTNTASKALLLLHDVGKKPTVWNDFVSRFFNNNCPVVYGGVILGKDSLNSLNNVLCYRIAFGYYDSLIPKTFLTDDNLLAIEIRAAVLGIINRHPNITLTLFSQSTIVPSAKQFMSSPTAEETDIVALLSLLPQTTIKPTTSSLFLPVSLKFTWAEKNVMPTIKQIHSALGSATGSWWLSQ